YFVDDGGELRLAQVRGAGQQEHGAVGAEKQALKEAEPERLVAGQVVHAFLAEQQQAVERMRGHHGAQALLALKELRSRERQCARAHVYLRLNSSTVRGRKAAMPRPAAPAGARRNGSPWSTGLARRPRRTHVRSPPWSCRAAARKKRSAPAPGRSGSATWRNRCGHFRRRRRAQIIRAPAGMPRASRATDRSSSRIQACLISGRELRARRILRQGRTALPASGSHWPLQS